MVDAPADSRKAVRRFPLPWRICESAEAFWVECAEGKRFGYCYFAPEGGQTTGEYHKLTRAEALVIVRNIVKLPEHIGPR